MPSQTTDSTYWAVDFDRCLGNVDVLFDHYMRVLSVRYNVSVDDIVAARQKVEASKGSFDLIDYLLKSGILTKNDLPLVAEKFINVATVDPAALMPGAREFLEYLDRHYRGRYGILTFGNPYWQRLKIAAAGLADVPCIIVDSPRKARQIASWYDEQVEGFIVPRLLAGGQNADAEGVQEVILVDDKLVAFDQPHEKMRGYLVSAQRHAIDTAVGGRIEIVSNPREIIEKEQEKHNIDKA